MQISVIIPAFNEAKVIANTVAQVNYYLGSNFQSFEIIVIDDKSTDSTLNIIQGLTGIKVLRNLKNHGKGYTVAKGMKVGQGDYLLFMDADSSTKISELDKLFKYKDNYPVIIGSRALAESEVKLRQNWIKVLLGRGGNLLSRILIAPDIKDTQCGFKMFSRQAKFIFGKLSIEDFGFDFELIFLARKYGLAIKEVPIVWYNDTNSTVRWYHYPKVLGQLFKIRFNNLLGKY